MEEFEIEYEKGYYWGVFFIVLLVVGLVGHNLVFNNKKEKQEKTKVDIIEEKIDFDSYKGVWQLFLDEGDHFPAHELCINYINADIITFNYYLDGYKFENQTAKIVVDDNSASFVINDEVEGDLSGKIIFKNNKVFLAIISSNIDDIATGTIEFRVKTDDSLLA